MWKLLHEWYSGTTTFSKATVPRTLAQMKHTGQPMHHYVAKWESCAAQLAFMDAPMDKGLLVIMFTESFRDCLKSSYGMVLSAFLTKKYLTLQALT